MNPRALLKQSYQCLCSQVGGGCQKNHRTGVTVHLSRQFPPLRRAPQSLKLPFFSWPRVLQGELERPLSRLFRCFSARRILQYHWQGNGLFFLRHFCRFCNQLNIFQCQRFKSHSLPFPLGNSIPFLFSHFKHTST